MVAPSARPSPVLLALRGLLALLLSLTIAVQPATAQSVLRDAETEAFLNDITRPLAIAAGLAPGNLRIVLIGDNDINAFVAGGQVVYINSGTIEASDDVNEIQGVIAHEIGHIAGGHVTLASQNARGATGISLLSLLLGAAAIAAGGAEAGMGILSAGQQAALGSYLAFSRSQEASADAFAVKTLDKAKLSGAGMISFFGKLRQQEYRLSSSYAKIDPYAQTHPMSGDRQAALQGDVTASPYYTTKTDPALQARFLRVRAKLTGFIRDPESVLNRYPERDQSMAARYARAYAWHKKAYPDKAVAEVDKLVATAPHDPFFLELKGQVLLESGKPLEALPPLREAVARAPNQPLIAALFGHALIATEDPANFAEARKVLRVAVARDNENPFAWYQLGIIYDREGDRPRAALATAERYSLENNPRLALASAEMALHGIPEGTPDWLRAQDIAMVSRNQVQDQRKKR
jgi:predicted Zn-dependent protease